MALVRFSAFRLCTVLLLGILAACAQTDATAPSSRHIDSGADAVRAEEPTALPTLHDMIGLERDQVTALLGTPTFRRLDTPADLWQYGNAECMLDLFLYRVRHGNVFKVTHADVRTVNGTTQTKAACFTGLIKKHIVKQPG